MPDLDELIARRKKALDGRAAKADAPEKDKEVRRLRKLLKRAQRRKLKRDRSRRLAERAQSRQPAASES